MKKTLFSLILLTGSLVLAQADDPTALQVAPSDQIKYPDASQVINKTGPVAPPADTPAVPAAPNEPTSQPLVAATPIPAAAASLKPVPPSPLKKNPAAGEWFLKWTLSGDEAGALAWAQGLNRGAEVHKIKEGLWEVWAGPFDAAGLKEALAGQVGVATLVRK